MNQRTPILALLLLLAVACGGKSESAETMEKPWNGSPVGASFTSFGEKNGERSVTLQVHNFGDAPVLSYSFMLRYFDKSGAPLKVQAGTPFESDVDTMSMSGTPRDELAPKKNKQIVLDFGMNVPAEAASAEILVTKVGGANADLTPKEIWSAPYSQSWPEKPGAAAKPVAE